MIFVNLTPHVVNVRDANGDTINIQPNGGVARVAEKLTRIAVVGGISLNRQERGEVEGLPATAPETMYIVSAQVRLAVPHRLDVLSPGPLIRNEAGQPIGCDGFICN